MWVKFELTGELEEQFKALCDEECRTLSQQGLYIIKQYLKNNKMERNVQGNNFVEQARTGENESEQIRTQTELKEPKIVDVQVKKDDKQEQSNTKSEQVGTGENKSEQTGTEQEDFRQMQDDLVLDVLNF